MTIDEILKSEDPLYEAAKEIAIEMDYASASLLQRRLKIGYASSARLLDMLEEKGVISPPSKPYWKRRIINNSKAR